jgi:hypothetical protein
MSGRGITRLFRGAGLAAYRKLVAQDLASASSGRAGPTGLLSGLWSRSPQRRLRSRARPAPLPSTAAITSQRSAQSAIVWMISNDCR